MKWSHVTNPAQWDGILNYMGNSRFLLKGKVKNTLSFLISPFFLPGIQGWRQAILDHVDESTTRRRRNSLAEGIWASEEEEAADQPGLLTEKNPPVLCFKPLVLRSLANKGPSSQSYGFSSSHVWMWEVDYKESWAPKNWCFWTVVLEKTLCDPMDCSTLGLPVHHQLLEFTQTHVYWVGDAIQPSHPLSSPSPPAFSLSQHQGLSQWVNSSHLVAKVLAFQLRHQSFQWIFRADFL